MLKSVAKNRRVDKLVKVWSLKNEEIWILIHIEIQSHQDKEFPLRMFTCYYRLWDTYQRPVASLAILADKSLTWRPTEYFAETWGCSVKLKFPVIKLIDYQDKLVQLKQSTNPFATVVIAYLASLTTQTNEQARYQHKTTITRSLYNQGLSKKEILHLYTFIDWILALPAKLELKYINEVNQRLLSQPSI